MTGPVDDTAARRSIRRRLDVTQFVEAGAGTGKTTALVARIVELVATGTARLDQIAAITFTEAAAGELRDRVGSSLEQMADGRYHDEFAPEPADRDGDARAQRARAAVAELDAAAISTLHGFARRILAEHPFEAGLPPTFEVFDEIRSQVAFGERWAALLDELLGDAVAGPAVLRLLVCGVTLERLREVAEQFNESWDLVAECPPPDVESPPRVDGGPVASALREAEDLTGHCTDADDKLFAHIGKLEGLAERLEEAADDLDALQLLAEAPRLTFGHGRRANWTCPIDDVREVLERAEAARVGVVERSGRAALSQFLAASWRLTLGAAEARRAGGRLEFHDLLVLARDLVRRSAEVSRSLGDQYRFVLIDEFQDTDPIQVELAVRIATEDPWAADKDWRALTVEPGRLFFVGDPLQSIYRFRRADISVFLDVRDRQRPGALQLTGNHRSVRGVIGWVNQVFAELIGDGEPAMQPAYRPLAPQRTGHIVGAGSPPVVVLGGAIDTDEPVDQIREREAADIAGAIERIRTEGWAVGDEGRAATLADVTVLVPARTSLPILQRALEDAAIPYRLESSSLVYAAAEVRDLLTVLRSVDDPTDEVAIVAALRSPLFGCGDDDLYAFHRAAGRWDYREPHPQTLDTDHPVVAGQRSLAELYRVRWWHDVSALIEKVLTDRRQMELALDEQRPREAWRRLRFVADQARQFTDAFGGDLRHFLAWADLQCVEGSRVTESVLPEIDDDAVRIMTIHASKGLEFPIVIMTGLNAASADRGGRWVLWGDAGPEVSLSKSVRTPGYEALARREEAMEEHERLRLLYVAATRARDHLVVSVHHKAGIDCAAAGLEAAAAADPTSWRRLGPPLPGSGRDPRPPTPPPDPLADSPGARARWIEARRARLARADRPRTLAATAVARLAAERAGASGPGARVEGGGDRSEDADGRATDRAAWRRGRAGTAVGRAVHATLQQVDLVHWHGLAALAEVQAVAEGVPTRVREIERLASAALGSPTVRDAVAGGRYWRELYVGAPVGDRVLEGFVDLLVDEGDGLAVVDYKTDQLVGDEEREQALARYRPQGAAYAVAVEEAVGRPVHRCTFLFLRPGGAVALEIPDLELAKAEVRSLLLDA